MRRFVVMGMMGLLPGCGMTVLSDRATNPVIEDDATGQREFSGLFSGRKLYTVISMNAGRRMVLVSAVPDSETGRAFVCAEPPPDAVEAYANAARVEGRQTVTALPQRPGSEAEAAAARGFAVSSAPLLYRSQGLQVLRDMLAHLCTMRMNRVITSEAYASMVVRVLDRVLPLIEAEREAIHAAAARAPVTVVAPVASLTTPGGTPPSR